MISFGNFTIDRNGLQITCQGDGADTKLRINLSAPPIAADLFGTRVPERVLSPSGDTTPSIALLPEGPVLTLDFNVAPIATDVTSTAVQFFYNSLPPV